MIRWRDQGVLIATRRHGENDAIIEMLTPDHGRALGVVRGGGGRRMAATLQPGTQLDVTWQARLDAHLGHFTVEPLRSRAAQVMASRRALGGLNALCAMISLGWPERAPLPSFYGPSEALFDLLGQDDLWPLAYLRWEMALLDQLGYGLQLTECAATGTRTDLAYISPKTGRAVSAEGAGEWAARLLPLAPALIGLASEDADIRAALAVTGHFLQLHLAPERGLPPAREAFIARL